MPLFHPLLLLSVVRVFLLLFQLADEIGLEVVPVAYTSQAAFDEETGEQLSFLEVLAAFFNFAGVCVDLNSYE